MLFVMMMRFWLTSARCKFAKAIAECLGILITIDGMSQGVGECPYRGIIPKYGNYER